MTLVESLPYAIFCMCVVFVVLIILFLIIKLFSVGVGLFTGNDKEKSNPAIVSKPIAVIENGPQMSCGELKLHNVDERTAAMIMAIISDQTDIPLDELCFKSIKAKD